LYDQQTALVAFNANVGITDRTETDITTATERFSLSGKRSIIPADGWVDAGTNTNSLAAFEYKMQSTASDSITFDYSTPSYLWRTYELTYGSNSYFGAVRAQIMAPEIFTDQASFKSGLPSSAKDWSVYTNGGTSGANWVADKALTADATTALLTTSLTTPWAASATVKNSITANVFNGDSFVVALDHLINPNTGIEWLAPGTAGLNELELRERTACSTPALSAATTPCVPAFGFRVPVSAKTGDKWYAAMKATVSGGATNNLANGVYYVAIIATVTAPIRHYPTWSSLDTERTAMIAWRWTATGMPTSTTTKDNGGW